MLPDGSIVALHISLQSHKGTVATVKPHKGTGVAAQPHKGTGATVQPHRGTGATAQGQGGDDLEAAHAQQVEFENAQTLDRILVPSQLRKAFG